MAEDDSSQDKTEEPTQKRRDDARAEGQVATSREMFVFAALALATLALAMGRDALARLPARWAEGLILAPAPDLAALAVTRLGDALWGVLAAGLIVGLPCVAVAIGTQVAVGGLTFAPKAIGPKWSRLDPLAGLKRMVSAQSAVELAKAILKVGLLIAAGALALKGMLPALERTSTMATGDGLAVLGQALVRVLVALTLVLAAVGVLDLLWQLHRHTASLRMSREEMKQEFKDSEGSPELKGRIRSLQYQAARRAAERGSVAAVPQATAIVTNPGHFAVALRYVPGQPGAPVIVAMGRDAVAQEIKAIGRRRAIPTLPAPPLARALYFTGRIGDEIPVDLYAAVATLLAHVWRVAHGQPEPQPDIELPEAFRFDAHGRRARPRKGPDR